MLFIPSDVSTKLEFEKVKELLSAHCVCALARQKITSLSFLKQVDLIDRALSEVSELRELISEFGDIPLLEFDDISNSLFLLSKENYVLELELILEIKKVVISFGELYTRVVQSPDQRFLHIKDILNGSHFEKSIVKLISSVLDDEGNVLPNASPELASIFRRIGEKEREVYKVFNSIVGKYKDQGMLTDTAEGVKNGRRVLAIPAEYKRKVKGVIHDESSTGKTSFIEPQEVVVINNFLLELEVEKRKEIYKILRALCDQLRPYISNMEDYQEKIVVFDALRAKVKLANQMEANKPSLSPKPQIQLQRAFHPLLLLKNKETGVNTIPFNMGLVPPNKVLLISGPNAGGKSVTMKAVGLIQMMVQAGCLVPVAEQSIVGVFDHIFCDIGDQQSLEDDLSTYSSRLKNMKAFLENATTKTLILIDEFGSGTDPKAGGAIAESILFKLARKKVFGVITTHYSNLKIFAYKMRGLVNGAMHFDEAELKPTYELNIGKPGSSFAFEIARQAGLEKEILNYAKKRAGRNNQAVDNLLVDLQKEKKELENKLDKLISREDKLDKLIKNYENLLFDLDIKRKRLKMEKKQFQIQETSNERKELEKLLRELRSEKKITEVKEILEEKKKKTSQSKSDLDIIQKELISQNTFDIKKLKVGDHVKVRSNGMKGEVISINKDKIEISHGILSVTVKVTDIEGAPEYLEINRKKGIQYNLQKPTIKFETELDLRGYRKSEAEEFIQEFLDQALLNNADLLKILHGKGSGAIRKSVWKKVKEYPDVKKIWHPEDNLGGDGVTFIRL